MSATHFSGPIVSTAGFKPGASTQSVTYVLQGSVTVDPANLAANSSAETELTISGAAVGDMIIFNVPASLEAGLAFSGARVSAADTVQLRLSNVTGSGVDGASRSWSYLVIRVA